MIIEGGSPNVSRLEGVYAYPLWRYSNQSIAAVHKIQTNPGQISSKMIASNRREELSVGWVGLDRDQLSASAAHQTVKADLTLHRPDQQRTLTYTAQGSPSITSQNGAYENGPLPPIQNAAQSTANSNALLGLRVDLLA